MYLCNSVYPKTINDKATTEFNEQKQIVMRQILTQPVVDTNADANKSYDLNNYVFDIAIKTQPNTNIFTHSDSTLRTCIVGKNPELPLITPVPTVDWRNYRFGLEEGELTSIQSMNEISQQQHQHLQQQLLLQQQQKMKEEKDRRRRDRREKREKEKASEKNLTKDEKVKRKEERARKKQAKKIKRALTKYKTATPEEQQKLLQEVPEIQQYIGQI
jgi:hypothetical protein